MLIQRVAFLLGLFAILGLALTFAVEAGFMSQAREVQPVIRDKSSDTGWRFDGPPRKLIGLSPTQFVTQGGFGALPQVDLRQTNETTRDATALLGVIHLARLGSALVFTLAIIAPLLYRRIVQSHVDWEKFRPVKS
jgi:hypothetical protein